MRATRLASLGWGLVGASGNEKTPRHPTIKPVGHRARDGEGRGERIGEQEKRGRREG